MSLVQNKYLLRSSREVLGPYSKEEVIGLIKRGRISVFDEVTEPFEIWMALRDHKDFKTAVQSIDMQTRITNFLTDISSKITKTKKSDKTKTRTLTDTHTTKTKTSGKTTTQTLTDTTKTSDQTITLTQQEKESASEVDFQVIPTKTKKGSRGGNRYQSKEESEEKVRRKIGFFVKTLWRGIILSAVLTLSFIAYNVVYKPEQEKTAIKKSLNTKGLPLYEEGDYLAAIPYFEKAREQALLSDQQKLLYSSLLLKQNKSQKADLLKNEISDPNVLNSETGLLLSALIDFYDEDYSRAVPGFQNLINLNKNREITHQALINLAILEWKQEEYKASLNSLDKLISKNFSRDIVWYLKALNLLYQNHLEDLENYLKNRLFLDKDTIVVEFKQELFLMLAYIEMKNNNKDRMQYYIEKFFNEDPFMYQNYNYHPLIAVNRLNWNDMFSYCQEIFQSNPNDNWLGALYAFCLFKKEQFDLADRELERLKSSEPKNPLFLSLYAYFLIETKQAQEEEIEQIFSLIDYDSLGENHWLALILKAYFRQSQMDWSSSTDLWKILLSKDPNNVSALVGMAINSYQLQDIAMGNVWVQSAISKYPYHRKLIPYKK